MDIDVGSVVRHRRWGGRFVGTVTRRAGDTVSVRWRGSDLDDELGLHEVEAWPRTSGDPNRTSDAELAGDS